MLIHKNETHEGHLRNFLSLVYSTEGLSTYFWIKKILKQSPKIKTFRYVLQFSSIPFWNVFQKSTIFFLKFSNIREGSKLFFFLLDISIYIIEQYTNLKYIKHQEKQITFKSEYIYVINHPT